ncbi:hypothetical protein [Holdemania massiliensis]|uniref:hypothetical protein n=1 Tax=Holdemania massiliensis TaxID=1468449 RepID=UPI0002E76F9C|nr:hypothetical protein [Holdemania massiliensis]
MPEALKKSVEMQEKILKSTESILQQHEQMWRIIDNATRVNISKLPSYITQDYSAMFENPAIKAISERQNAFNALTASLVEPLQAFNNSYLDKINESMSLALKAYSDSATRLLADSVRNIVGNMGSALFEAVHSPAIEWIQSIDFSPMFNLLQGLNFDSDVLKRYRELNKVYLATMYECKWFPYAGWTVSMSLMSEVSDIIATSRGKSKRRELRIDKAILGYYTPKKIKNIKRTWRNSDLEPHIKKILGQAIEAHLRGEYALTITCLATMWEGLIHRKLHIEGRCGQKKTKEKFAELIDENDFEPIFADFYENLIVSQCDTPDDVIEGVPNRNGVSHSKYQKYPNKKASLNAILLTDFIIALEPKLEMEEN